MSYNPQAVVFPDAEDVWINYLADMLDSPIGSNLFPDVKFVRVLRAGGTLMNKVTDNPQMVFDCYDADAALAAKFAADTRALVFAAEGCVIAPGVKVKALRHVTGPSQLTDEETESSRYSFTVMTALSGVAVNTDDLKGQ